SIRGSRRCNIRPARRRLGRADRVLEVNEVVWPRGRACVNLQATGCTLIHVLCDVDIVAAAIGTEAFDIRDVPRSASSRPSKPLRNRANNGRLVDSPGSNGRRPLTRVAEGCLRVWEAVLGDLESRVERAVVVRRWVASGPPLPGAAARIPSSGAPEVRG